MVKLSYLYVTTGKTIALIRQTFFSKVIFLLFNTQSLSFSQLFLQGITSWLQSPSAVILEFKKINSVSVSTFSPSICHEVMGLNVMILVFWMLSFKPAFSFFSFTLIKKLLVRLCFLTLEWYHLENGAPEDETVGWHQWFNGNEFEQTPGDGERQVNLSCCSPHGVTKSWTRLSDLKTTTVNLHIWGCWCFSQQFWFQLVSLPAWHFEWCTLHTR